MEKEDRNGKVLLESLQSCRAQLSEDRNTYLETVCLNLRNTSRDYSKLLSKSSSSFRSTIFFSLSFYSSYLMNKGRVNLTVSSCCWRRHITVAIKCFALNTCFSCQLHLLILGKWNRPWCSLKTVLHEEETHVIYNLECWAYLHWEFFSFYEGSIQWTGSPNFKYRSHAPFKLYSLSRVKGGDRVGFRPHDVVRQGDVFNCIFLRILVASPASVQCGHRWFTGLLWEIITSRLWW